MDGGPPQRSRPCCSASEIRVRPEGGVRVLGDRRCHPFLCKPKDDLRKDSRMMEFNTMINRLLKKDEESRHPRGTRPRLSHFPSVTLIVAVPLTVRFIPLRGFFSWAPLFRILRLNYVRQSSASHVTFGAMRREPPALPFESLLARPLAPGASCTCGPSPSSPSMTSAASWSGTPSLGPSTLWLPHP